MPRNPNDIAKDAVNDLKDFLQRCWNLGTNPDHEDLIPELIRETIASNSNSPDHLIQFYISALEACRKEIDYRRNVEYKVKIEARNKQDRHKSTLLDIA